jgi:post-segregation antitoxin (ccd killing protein)
MNAPFGPKRPVQLDLDADLVARAEALGTSLASTVEAALAAHLAAAEQGVAARKARATDHARFTAAVIERHGDWGEEFRTL